MSISIPQGQLVVVVGKVGSGKSSLLQAVLGEMACSHGKVGTAGSFAFTAQEPWIRNASLRDNILSNAPYDEERYKLALEACALAPDLEMLPAGDLSEIGEKGINLSGGQRHRVALARALYADADVYLLDDPLSAVDAHVGNHLFERCICGAMAGKTRVLVTHQTQFADSADMIYVMDDGMVTHSGTYNQLVDQGLEFSSLVNSTTPAGSEEGGGPDSLGSGAGGGGGRDAGKGEKNLGKPGVGGGKKGGKDRSGEIVKAEERARGRIKTEIYSTYLRAWGPMFILPILLVLFALAERGLQVGQSAWLAVWSEGTQKDGSWHAVRFYLGVYACLGLGSLVLQAGKAVFLVKGTINSSRELHSRFLNKVMRLPMSFFESQPTGRLLNRFAKDTESVDTSIASSMNSFISCVVTVIGSVVVILVVTPAVSVFLAPLMYLYYSIQTVFISANRELKRLDRLGNSPIFGNFAESLRGVATIRAFGLEENFEQMNSGLIDSSNKAYWPLVSSNRWLSVRLEFVGNSIVFATAMCVAILSFQGAGMAGLAITSSLNLTGLMSWLVRMSTELEVNMNSVERLLEYDSLPTEADLVIESSRPSSSWPSNGEIQFRDLYVRYREDLAPVLKGLNFTVQGRQKVGICGRTGCGKSTLMITIYRLIEPYGGRVLIDGVDTGTLGLHDLRSRLALVPQEPVLFTGTMRDNLDPFKSVENDAVLWQALEQSGLKDHISSMPNGLDSQVTEGGQNLSVGQRQLLCMARALVRGSKILLLDEATSNVDNKTDEVIQKTIRSAFKDCTVLTIAHRIHTIVDSDRILVLEAGEIAEFDTPEALMNNPQSHFSALLRSSRGAGSGLGSRNSSTPMLAQEGSPPGASLL